MSQVELVEGGGQVWQGSQVNTNIQISFCGLFHDDGPIDHDMCICVDHFADMSDCPGYDDGKKDNSLPGRVSVHWGGWSR